MTGPVAAPAYPLRASDRDAWIVGHRPPRQPRRPLDPTVPIASFLEHEVDAAGIVETVATILLTNRECPYRCLMCDLWQHTLETTVSGGAIAGQIERALAALPNATAVKLYNSGSFFDHRAIPPDDYQAIAARLRGFRRVIVECHPALVGPDVAHFRAMLRGDLEVAMGLETAHPEVLPRLNKRMTLESYAAAARQLRELGVATRAFVLVQPPFLPEGEAVEWAVRSAAFAFDNGAGTVSLIPVRAGNGALDALAATGDFTRPTLATLESAFDQALGLHRGRVFADIWDLARFSTCAPCLTPRTERLRAMNLSQQPAPRVRCDACGAR